MVLVERPEQVEPLAGQELCHVCSDIANGIHFGVSTCEGCKVFKTSFEKLVYNLKMLKEIIK